MPRATWRGLETWHGRKACRRASPRPTDRGDRGNVGIIRSPIRASILPDPKPTKGDPSGHSQRHRWTGQISGAVFQPEGAGKCCYHAFAQEALTIKASALLEHETMKQRSARPRSLRGEVDGIERLARGHEEAVALGAAEANVGADLRQERNTKLEIPTQEEVADPPAVSTMSTHDPSLPTATSAFDGEFWRRSGLVVLTPSFCRD